MTHTRCKAVLWFAVGLCWSALASAQYVAGRSLTDNTLAALSRTAGFPVSDPDGRLFAVLAKLERYPDLQFVTTKASGTLVRIYGTRANEGSLSIRAVTDRVALDIRVTGTVLFDYAPAYCIIRGSLRDGAVDATRMISENTPATLAVALNLPGARSMERTAAYFDALIEMARLGRLGPITAQQLEGVNRFRTLFLVDPAANLPKAMARPLAVLDAVDGLRPVVAALQGDGETGGIPAEELVELPALFKRDTVFNHPDAIALFEEGRRLQLELLHAGRVLLNDRVGFYRPSANEPALALALIRHLRELHEQGRLRPDLAAIELVNNRETGIAVTEAGLIATLNPLTATQEDVDRLLTGPGRGTPRPPLAGLLSQHEQDALKASALESFARIDAFRAAIEPFEAGLGELEATVDLDELEKALDADYKRYEAKGQSWVDKLLH